MSPPPRFRNFNSGKRKSLSRNQRGARRFVEPLSHADLGTEHFSLCFSVFVLDQELFPLLSCHFRKEFPTRISGWLQSQTYSVSSKARPKLTLHIVLPHWINPSVISLWRHSVSERGPEEKDSFRTLLAPLWPQKGHTDCFSLRERRATTFQQSDNSIAVKGNET